MEIKRVWGLVSRVCGQNLFCFRPSLFIVLILLLTFYSSLFALFTACGRKGDPKVPVRYVPGAVEELIAIPKENTVLLRWKFPEKNEDGSPIKDLAGFVILRADISESVYEYKKVSSIDLDKPEPSIIKENMVVYVDKGDDLSPRGLSYGKTYGYMILSVNKSKILSKERVSKITLSVPPSIPGSFRATPGEGTATLSWTPPLKRIDGSELTDLKGYNIYRSKEKGIYGDRPINAGLIVSLTFRDQGLENNIAYYYIIKAVNTLTPPWNEGPPSDEISATPQRMTPPSPPKRLIAVPADNKIFLTWDENKEIELAGYRVYRSLSSKTGYSLLPPETIFKTTFTDTNVVPKRKYYYRVTAIDNALKPNESLPSEVVETQIK